VQITRPHEITPHLTRQPVDCWTAVINAGGAVIASSGPTPRRRPGLRPRLTGGQTGPAAAGRAIVAVDMDRLLLESARTHHADAARYVGAVIGETG
jgi:hypothetical protein